MDLVKDINLQIGKLQEWEKDYISDGYHTFKELYEYRKLYNAAFFNELATSGKCKVHKSKRHNTGEECFGGGWFIVMADLPTGQVSNHYELKDWDLFQCPEQELADKWDGHTPAEAAQRIKEYLLLPVSADREQQIKEASYDEYDEEYHRDDSDYELKMKCFRDGARWADSHPK